MHIVGPAGTREGFTPGYLCFIHSSFIITYLGFALIITYLCFTYCRPAGTREKAREEEEAATRERERANLRSIAELWRYVQAQAAANNGPPPPNLVFLHPPTQPAVVDPFLTLVSSCSLP